MGRSTDHIVIDARSCHACGKCIEACPKGVLGTVKVLFHAHAHVDEAEQCRGCLKCVRACPRKAILSRRGLEKAKASGAPPAPRQRRNQRHDRWEIYRHGTAPGPDHT
ncbi:MAG: 4Fe-4S binding protein [Syntrophomonadaceae bacterium]|nr:4Fe-4S binding protein [Syntrophomonadaceae bacterium]MDH7497251.1 4Fe-4S binding protein [Syntrophomonadaceae bacterium]